MLRMMSFLLAGALALPASLAQAATFSGQDVTLFHFYANNSYQPGPLDDPKITVTGKGVFKAGPGIVLSDDRRYDWDAPYYTIDLVGDRITIDLFDTSFGTNGDLPAYFIQNNGRNGLVLQDTFDVLPDFSALTLIANDFDYDPLVSVTANQLVFDFSSAGDNRGAAATWAVTTAVPLPATLPMLLAAGGSLALMRRRRSKS